jgi:hypothetical protein
MSLRQLEDLQMQSPKTVRLYNLVDGCPFTIPSLDDQFKLLYLVRGNDSTCKVQGYKKTEAGGYSPFSDFFSPGTQVVPDKTRQILSSNKNGELSIPKEYIAEISNEKKEENKKQKNKGVKKMSIQLIETLQTNKNSVGRPKKHRIELPHGEEFTVSKIAQKLGVKKFVVNNEIARIQRENPENIRVVGSLTQSKGKPARVFKLI